MSSKGKPIPLACHTSALRSTLKQGVGLSRGDLFLVCSPLQRLLRSVARGQFPSAAKQILHDLRHGVHDSKRRASAPAIHSLEFNSPGQARKRATVCAHPVAEIEPFEHPFAANRREETLSLDLLEVMEDHQKEQKDEPQEVGTVATGRSKTLAKQSSRISTATSSMRWRQPECAWDFQLTLTEGE